MYTYKNLTDHEQVVPNVGIVPPQGTIPSEFELHNPNLKPITNEAPVVPVPPAPAPQPVQAVPEPPQEGEN